MSNAPASVSLLAALSVAGALPANVSRRLVRPMLDSDESHGLGNLLASTPDSRRLEEERIAYAKRRRELKGKRRAAAHSKALGGAKLPKPKKLTKKQKKARAHTAIARKG